MHSVFLTVTLIRNARMRGIMPEMNVSSSEEARILMDRNGGSYDLRSAAEAASRGVESSDPDAMYLAGLFTYLGEGGVPMDKDTAVQLFAKAVEAGSKEAAIVVSEFDRADPGQMDGFLALRFRGEQRDVEACAELFDVYEEARKPAKKNHAEAIRWYTVCAEAGNVAAQYQIGFMYTHFNILA